MFQYSISFGKYLHIQKLPINLLNLTLIEGFRNYI